jgi:2-oxoglutarate dehydrogenase E2 component (dihydrolipoamide succinyltransferase)
MTDISVPPLGDSITEATIARWLKREGESVAVGETIVELETDKINVEVPAQASGVLSRRLKAEGDTVGVGETLGHITAGASAGAPPSPAATATVPATATPRAAPSATRLAAEQGIPLAGITGTGRGGVISKPDVLDTLASGPPATAAPRTPASPAPARAQTPAGARETREAMSTRRKRIAENLLHSQLNTAHLTTFNEVDMTAVMDVRARHRERVEKEYGVKLTFMPFFAKATVMALNAYPVVNAQVDGDTIVYKHYVNLGIAVASDQGLVVPNIKDAHAKGLIALTSDMTSLAKKARDVKLTMDDLTGGTFTISNGGVFGSLISTPIINFPQSAILGLHKIQERPMVVGGAVVARPMMYIALSYDHRIIDGQHAVLFLVRVKELMEDPAAMLIE